MGDAEKYLVGELGDCESGIAVCKKIIDDFLQLHRHTADSPEGLLAEYESSGPDPYIDSDDSTCRFSAAQYVRRRIGEIFR